MIEKATGGVTGTGCCIRLVDEGGGEVDRGGRLRLQSTASAAMFPSVLKLICFINNFDGLNFFSVELRSSYSSIKSRTTTGETNKGQSFINFPNPEFRVTGVIWSPSQFS